MGTHRRVVKGVSFLLRLTVTADDGSERLVSTARTTETTYRFTQLALGRYTLTVRAVKCVGAAGRSGIGIVPDCGTGSACHY
ncbi:fibronectin type III [Escherichia coli]|uniref:Fibronectin type III n=1 Tax=Escherichia coli TaxID=562 RepID=A0A2X3KAD6_ECOLX|nr:fibronectin type III [Escherichia coli]